MPTSKPIPFPHKEYGLYYVEENLRDAAYRGDLKRLQELLRLYPTLNVNATNEYSETALYIACKQKQNGAAEFLLEQPNVDINIPTILGNASLLICAWTDNTILAKTLVQRGADVHARTNPDRKYHGNVSAFDIAKERNNKELADFLQPYMDNAMTSNITPCR